MEKEDKNFKLCFSNFSVSMNHLGTLLNANGDSVGLG